MPLPPSKVLKGKLGLKCCQQYAIPEFEENIVLLDTGHDNPPPLTPPARGGEPAIGDLFQCAEMHFLISPLDKQHSGSYAQGDDFVGSPSSRRASCRRARRTSITPQRVWHEAQRRNWASYEVITCSSRLPRGPARAPRGAGPGSGTGRCGAGSAPGSGIPGAAPGGSAARRRR